jgi:hypothetical protein
MLRVGRRFSARAAPSGLCAMVLHRGVESETSNAECQELGQLDFAKPRILINSFSHVPR